MRLFDSHCHLDDRAYDKDLDDVIHRMHDAGVVSAMTIGTTFERCIKGIAIAESIPGVYASVGIHPHDAKSCDEDVPVFVHGGKSALTLIECFLPETFRKSGLSGSLKLPTS